MNDESARPLELEAWMREVHQFSGVDGAASC